MNVKEYTKDLHDIAERLPFVKALLTNNATKEEYTNYLYQLLAIYSPIEFSSRIQGLFNNMPGIDRLSAIYQDYMELMDSEQLNTLLPETVQYHNYLINLTNDPARRHLVHAHNYVRYMGDLNGGQYFAKVVPGQGRMYQFTDPGLLSAVFRTTLKEDQEFLDEARLAFYYMIRILRALKSA